MQCATHNVQRGTRSVQRARHHVHCRILPRASERRDAVTFRRTVARHGTTAQRPYAKRNGRCVGPPAAPLAALPPATLLLLLRCSLSRPPAGLRSGALMAALRLTSQSPNRFRPHRVGSHAASSAACCCALRCFQRCQGLALLELHASLLTASLVAERTKCFCGVRSRTPR
jgi:hypothetical protein